MNDKLMQYSESVPESMKQLQIEFASYIRNPIINKPPSGIESRRMKIYARLFYSSISSLLAGTFRIIREINDPQKWQKLVRDFYRPENNHSPHFPEISRDFVSFLKTYQLPKQQPFLAELAHYEWIEMAINIDKREVIKQAGLTPDDFIQNMINTSSLARLNVYNYPVHQISKQFQPLEKLEQEIYILVYRNTADKVKFIELNPLSAVLFEKLQMNTQLTGLEILQQLALEVHQQDNQEFIGFGLQIILDWYHKDIIQGIKKTLIK
jgi:hypothetical protein